MNKVSIRFGIKQSGWFPNAGIFVIKTTPTIASIIVAGFEKIRQELLQVQGGKEWADKLVAEYR